MRLNSQPTWLPPIDLLIYGETKSPDSSPLAAEKLL
jgi:hypothetical protein